MCASEWKNEHREVFFFFYIYIIPGFHKGKWWLLAPVHGVACLYTWLCLLLFQICVLLRVCDLNITFCCESMTFCAALGVKSVCKYLCIIVCTVYVRVWRSCKVWAATEPSIRWRTSVLTNVGGNSPQTWLLLESKDEKNYFPCPEDNHFSSNIITWHVNKLKVDIVSMQTKSLKLINCTNLKQNNHNF